MTSVNGEAASDSVSTVSRAAFQSTPYSLGSKQIGRLSRAVGRVVQAAEERHQVASASTLLVYGVDQPLCRLGAGYASQVDLVIGFERNPVDLVEWQKRQKLPLHRLPKAVAEDRPLAIHRVLGSGPAVLLQRQGVERRTRHRGVLNAVLSTDLWLIRSGAATMSAGGSARRYGVLASRRCRARSGRPTRGGRCETPWQPGPLGCPRPASA